MRAGIKIVTFHLLSTVKQKECSLKSAANSDEREFFHRLTEQQLIVQQSAHTSSYSRDNPGSSLVDIESYKYFAVGWGPFLGRFHRVLLVWKPAAAEQLVGRVAHTHSPRPPPHSIRLLDPIQSIRGLFFFFVYKASSILSPRHHCVSRRLSSTILQPLQSRLFHRAVRYSAKLTV